jgi:pimeloyl-ACP methyl ester carboxylesterase
MFAPNLDAHDLLLQDDRGMGFSGAIDCKPLQHGLGLTLDDELADCAAQLSDDDSVYGNGDIAQDVEALRAALGYDLVDYYGQSFGGVDVISYATRFPQHVRSVAMDSPIGPANVEWFAGRRYWDGGATTQEIRLDCLRSPTCAADHPNPDAEFVQLIQDVRNNPLQGNAYDANGNLVPVNMDEMGLLNVVLNAGEGLILDGGELLAAGDSLQRGDTLPLLRLGAEAIISFVTDYGDPKFLSFGGAVAAACVDLQAPPYDWSVPPQQRLQQYAEAVSDLPRDYFAPFSITSYTTLSSDGVANSQNVGAQRPCLFWEEASTPPPIVPPGATYPNVPALVFSGDIEGATASNTAALFPDATYLVVPEGLHVPAASNQCGTNLITNLIETLQIGDTSCLNTPELIFPALGRFPLVAAEARPAEIDPGGSNEIGIPERKVVTVAVATTIDALKRSTIGSGNGVGLRSGTFQSSVDMNGNQTTTLTNCVFANDVTINGSLVWGADRSFVADVIVSGSGTAGGSLHIAGTWEAAGPVGKFRISGMLGGRRVAALVPEA